jgi:hypothetical protein
LQASIPNKIFRESLLLRRTRRSMLSIRKTKRIRSTKKIRKANTGRSTIPILIQIQIALTMAMQDNTQTATSLLRK